MKSSIKLLQELRTALQEELSNNTVSVEIFINSEGVEIFINSEGVEDLETHGVSMRNIQGEFIRKPAEKPTDNYKPFNELTGGDLIHISYKGQRFSTLVQVPRSGIIYFKFKGENFVIDNNLNTSKLPGWKLDSGDLFDVFTSIEELQSHE